MADAVVLDTSACFAFLEDEAGADVVEKYLLEARAGRLTVHASFATLTEVEYITTQERNTADATYSAAPQCPVLGHLLPHAASPAPAKSINIFFPKPHQVSTGDQRESPARIRNRAA